VLYGAAGVAHHAELTRLPLARDGLVSASELSLAERALTEMSEWTPHDSRAILDSLRPVASEPR